MNSLIRHFRSIFDTEATGRLILIAPVVGVVAGLGAAGFFWLLRLAEDLAQGQWMGYYPPPAGDEAASHGMQLPTAPWAVLLLVPTVGGLLCGLLVYDLAPEAEGHGTDAMVRCFHRLGGRIRARVPFVKSLASIITIGTGGSAGREGPIAQIGAGFGSFLATRLGLGENERRLLMLAGGAGGIGAIFRAPMGGALFVSEVLYGSTALEFAAVVPCFVSSITAYAVFALIFGQGLAFQTPARPGVRKHPRAARLPGVRRRLFGGRIHLRQHVLRARATGSSTSCRSPHFSSRRWAACCWACWSCVICRS